MPYWSIGEWRARIGSSWCALGRPFKTRSPFRGKTQRDLTLSRGVATLFLLIMSIGINLWLHTLVARGCHLPLLSECMLYDMVRTLLIMNQLAELLSALSVNSVARAFLADLSQGGTLPDRMYLINLGLILTLVLQITSAVVYQLLSMATRRSKSFSSDLTESFSFGTCFAYYSIFLILKMINPSMYPVHWMVLLGIDRECLDFQT